MELKSQTLYPGDTWTWTESLEDYPATAYTLTLYIKQNTTSSISVTAAASGTSHLFTVAAATTANYSSGTYDYQFVVTKISDSTVTTIERGTVEIYKSLASISDERTHNEKVLDALKSAMEGRATREQAEIETPSGVKIKYLSLSELRKEINNYQYKVNQERRQEMIKQGKAGGSRILVTF